MRLCALRCTIIFFGVCRQRRIAFCIAWRGCGAAQNCRPRFEFFALLSSLCCVAASTVSFAPPVFFFRSFVPLRQSWRLGCAAVIFCPHGFAGVTSIILWIFSSSCHGVFNCSVFPVNVTFLYLSENSVSGSVALRHFPNGLTSLDLSSKQFSGSVDLRYLPASLTSLIVHNNQLCVKRW